MHSQKALVWFPLSISHVPRKILSCLCKSVRPSRSSLAFTSRHMSLFIAQSMESTPDVFKLWLEFFGCCTYIVFHIINNLAGSCHQISSFHHVLKGYFSLSSTCLINSQSQDSKIFGDSCHFQNNSFDGL